MRDFRLALRLASRFSAVAAIGVSCILFASALPACAFSARRAVAVDPVVSLRYQ